MGTPGGALSLTELCLALVGPLCVLGISYRLNLRISQRIVITLLRTVVQLLLAGYVLLGFIFSMHSPVYVLGYLFLMVVISSFEVISRQVRTYKGYLRDSFLAVLVGGGGVGLYGSVLVFHTSPWWQPHIVVPTAGMLIGNSISGPALAVDRLFSEVCDRSHEIELRLAFGGTKFEAILPTIRAAMLVALTPNMNQMAVVGIVSIPGMMTGQLLAGASPLVAAEYQLVILWLIFATVGFSTLVGLYLALENAVFDNEHRLTLPKISKKPKTSIEELVANLASAVWTRLWSFVGRALCCYSNGRYTRSDTELSPLVPATELLKPIDAESTNWQQSGVIEVKEEHICNTVDLSMENISFSMSRGEILALEGPSGVGKTMFLRSLALFNKPVCGSLRFSTNTAGTGLAPLYMNTDTGFHHVPDWRKRCMYVPQAVPPLNLSPLNLLEEAIGFGCRYSPTAKATILSRCAEMEDKLLLGTGKLSLEWVKLSGGERQRAAIACALILINYDNEVCDSVLLLDEPTAACDAATTAAVEAALLHSGAAIILTTHDSRQSNRIAQ
ncbi:unnamed protein product, partial [Ectocarpus fasciculatus]